MQTDDVAKEVRERTHPWQSVLPANPDCACICARCGLMLPMPFFGTVPDCVGGPLPTVQDV